MVVAPAAECGPLAERAKASDQEEAMSKQMIGPREAALRAMRETQKPAKATVPELPATSGRKPVKRKVKRGRKP